MHLADLTEPLLKEHLPIQKPKSHRMIWFDGSTDPKECPNNAVSNTKYSVVNFLPLVLINLFKDFYNLFFLCIVLSQFFPQLQVGFLFSYLVPLIFVLTVTFVREAYDDFQRRVRDKQVNSEQYLRVTDAGTSLTESKELRVGHIIELHANERIPADLLLLQTSEPSGSVYIRTDQMDGETDWKLRRAVTLTQGCMSPVDFLTMKACVTAESPHKDIYAFSGSLIVNNEIQLYSESLNLDHMLWANTVLASGSALGLVVYTGSDTKSRLNATSPQWKRGVVDRELNFLAKLLFTLMSGASAVLLGLSGATSNALPRLFRYLLLLSPVIPISLRVNLDLARIYYSWLISTDRRLPGVKARNSNLPEELGRVQFLLCDKTGTLTRNEMTFKRLSLLSHSLSTSEPEDWDWLSKTYSSSDKSASRLRDCVLALALCHNVTPVFNERGKVQYQASSPDEVALVKFACQLGLELFERSTELVVLRTKSSSLEIYKLLAVFPFSSKRKRMGVVVQSKTTGLITFYLKGAEEVMKDSVPSVDSVRILEDCETFAREGLRTLVVSQRRLSQEVFLEWKRGYEAASLALIDRDSKLQSVYEGLERDMTALCVTGVEDRLQDGVPETIENMRNAGVKVWMLTGDKIETAQCIANSTRLRDRDRKWLVIQENNDPQELGKCLEDIRNGRDLIPIIDGASLTMLLAEFKKEFVEACVDCSAVICCRVSPTQKAEVTAALQQFTAFRVCAIGDGGNDVSMIQSAHLGIGIEGKEGKQAALAADFSVTEFKALNRLLLWHGRLSFKRTADLAHFIFLRGLLLAVIQCFFMCLFYFNPLPIFTGFLMLGYSSYYTNLPVLAVILDSDADVKTVMKFPILYQSVQKGRTLDYSMFVWVLWKGLYQGSAIILAIILLYPDHSYTAFASLAFTSLILAEQLNILSSTEHFHWAMGVCQVLTLLIYLTTIFLYDSFFDLSLVLSAVFICKVLSILAIAWLPLHLGQLAFRYLSPSHSSKIMQALNH